MDTKSILAAIDGIEKQIAEAMDEKRRQENAVIFLWRKIDRLREERRELTYKLAIQDTKIN